MSSLIDCVIKRISLIACSILMVSFAIHPPITVEAHTSYRYAYLVASDIFEAQMVSIDPNNLAASPQYQDLPIPSDWRPPSIQIVSPNAEWVVFISALKSDDPRALRLIRLVNFRSGEIREFEPDSVLNVAWSPNSQYLALTLLRDSNQEIFIHTIQGAVTHAITSDNAFHSHLIWSPDSEYFVSLKESCPPNSTNGGCTRMLEIYDVAKGSFDRSIDLDILNLGSSEIGRSACEVSWSPDGHYVSFAAVCSGTESSQEMYLWDLEQNTTERITDFTVSGTDEIGMRYAQARYAPFWLDTQTLLIGVRYVSGPGEGIFTRETIQYDVATQTLRTLFEGDIEDWTVNPLTNQIALRRTLPEMAAINQSTSNPINAAVEIYASDTIDVTTLDTTNNNLPDGCNLDWSPDGAFLAYIIPVNHCPSAATERFIFVDGTTRAIQTYTPLLENGETPYGVSPIGWVAG